MGNTKLDILACPICYERVTWNVKRAQCKTCRKLYSANNISHMDLTITGASENLSTEPLPASIQLFRLPLISYLYERGWRQCFYFGGFPGPEKEFEMIKDYVKPVLGGNIIDASCGSGIFSRLFAQSGLFSHVVALDFSETMLKQCFEFIKRENNFPEESLTLVKADISRLPFVSGSVDAVHAGAALHCWPSPLTAVAEISRVLKPGGLFVATTFVFDVVPQICSLIRPLRQSSIPEVIVKLMAISTVSGALLPRQLSSNPVRRRFSVLKSSQLMPFNGRLFAHKVCASSAAAVETKPFLLFGACFDHNVLRFQNFSETGIGASGYRNTPKEYIARSSLQCSVCRKSYSRKDSYFDLTITGGGKLYGELKAASTELFRFPLVSFLYERGWRQSFSLGGGFPGPEKEFEMIKDYLKPVLGGNIVDASCGSGMFSRLFAKSGLFLNVVALDFSEAMLKQCYDFVKEENNFPEENLIMVRADISRLPFATSSVDAVHAGAALHCWPSPSAAVAEISRVLKPGGIFVATTYIVDGPLSYIPLRAPMRQIVAQLSGSRVFLSEAELEDLCTSTGLVNFTCIRNRLFVMVSAMKPVQS
ncbi:S-adenosylmethionine-dependent methyltransferase [Striga asiatica]|uniref:S-adenosylmethionine-dependent methyltransferase n=1 Tax=Striga asiatica TaxID=4170 RepID=A0A5A7Q4Y0_STRAF|nr:S-adenosylmethionine-dependent methyltransferase [Striga asiatica]